MKKYLSKYGFPLEEMEERLRMEHIEKGKKIALEINPVIESVLEDYLQTYQDPNNKRRSAGDQISRSIKMISVEYRMFMQPSFGRWVIVNSIFGLDHPVVDITLDTITGTQLENPYSLGCFISGERSWFVKTILEREIDNAEITFFEKEWTH